MRTRTAIRIGVGLAATLALGIGLFRWELFEKRVAVVVPGRLVRGAWQRPGPLRALIDREKIRTIVSLTAINPDDPKYVDQKRVVDATGVDWVIVPMRGSRATLEQLAEAADLLADPDRQPVFFHCVAGHHRTSLTHAAYRIRHEGWSADRAWREVSGLSWSRPDADIEDRRLIEAFAAANSAARQGVQDASQSVVSEGDRPDGRRDGRPGDPGADRLAAGDGEFRDRPAGASLSVRPDEGDLAGEGHRGPGDPDRPESPGH